MSAPLASHPVPAPGPPCTPAAPPSRSEIERKLSFRSATSPRVDQSPRKKRSPSNVSGNDSDSSLASATGSSAYPQASPLLGSSAPSTGLPAGGVGPGLPGSASSAQNRQLAAIAERLRTAGGGEETEEYEEHDEGEDVSDEEYPPEQTDQELKQGEGELKRGMNEERVVRAGYLYKKQEKRKVWKKKWFVLRTSKLAYYKDDREYSLSRCLDLRTIQTAAPVKVKKHSFTFGLVTKKRTFLVEASSQSEMDEWVAAINTARRRLTEEAMGGVGVRQGMSTGTATPMNMEFATQSPNQPQGQAPGHDGGYSSSAAGTSPVISTGYLNRFGLQSTSMTSSPAQMHPISALPGVVSPTSPQPAQSSQPTSGLNGQMGRMGLGTPSQPVGTLGQPTSAQPIRSASSASRREPSASSLSSVGADYFPRTPSAGQSPHPPAPALHSGHAGQTHGQGQGVSSDSDDFNDAHYHPEEGTYFSDIASGTKIGQGSQFGTSAGTTMSAAPSFMTAASGSGMVQNVDPSRVILSAYLMKRSKGRGRKVWRKRWFYLTSQGLTYTKSHMDTKPLRNIPLSSILDAIDQSSALDDIDPSSSDSDGPARPTRSSSTAKLPSPPQRQLSALIHPHGHGHQPGSSSSSGLPGSASSAFGLSAGGGGIDGEHTFRLVTAKRNYVLCAPSEEDEIKWLAAVKALLNRERGMSSPVNEMAPRLFPAASPIPPTSQRVQQVPTITQQPPTPGSVSSASAVPLAPPIPADQTSPGADQQQQQQPPSVGLRGRSATYLAKSAVADVERRYHPEKQQQQPAAAV